MKTNKNKTTDANFAINLDEIRQFVEDNKSKLMSAGLNPDLEQLKALQGQIPPQTVGIDLGDRSHHVCVTDRLGHIVEERVIDNDKAALLGLSLRYPEARFVMEVGTHSPWISDFLRGRGCEVIVGNTRKIKAISENERKCDRSDSRLLSKIGRLDVDLLHPVTHVSQDALKDRLVLSCRENLVTHRKSLIQSVRGSVKPLSLRIESCSAEIFPKRARQALGGDPEVLSTLEPVLQSIETLNKSIAELDVKLEALSASKYPITERLRQVAGVGPITAIAFVLAIEDPKRIDGTRNVGAYFGLAPARDQSGESDPQKGISKTGNPYVRKLLTQCAQYVLGVHGPDCDLRRAGLRRASQCGDTKKSAKGAKKKAITAVARKLAVLLLSLWRSGEDYQPLRNHQPSNPAAI